MCVEIAEACIIALLHTRPDSTTGYIERYYPAAGLYLSCDKIVRPVDNGILEEVLSVLGQFPDGGLCCIIAFSF
jgi:hypothetical protein